jgi:hypothetical protein
MGEVGKTQLAARYARTHREDYDVIWWLRCEQVVTLRADLANLAAALGLVTLEIDEQEALRRFASVGRVSVVGGRECVAREFALLACSGGGLERRGMRRRL